MCWPAPFLGLVRPTFFAQAKAAARSFKEAMELKKQKRALEEKLAEQAETLETQKQGVDTRLAEKAQALQVERDELEDRPVVPVVRLPLPLCAQ